jgi:VWFA-related protein
VTLCAALVLVPPGVAAPQAAPQVPTFEATTELVYVRFHVEAKAGYLKTLAKEQVRVLEDGKPQPIALLETPSTRERTVPPEITLALDVSSSVMDARLLDEQLVRDVLFASLGEQARVGLCAFGGELRCFTPLTRDAQAVLDGFQQALRFAGETRSTGTRLYASLADLARADGASSDAPAVPPVARDKAQRALVVFSDGIDNHGGKAKQLVEAAREHDVRVYTVLLSQAFQDTARGPLLGGPPNRALYDYKKFDLSGAAEATGGRSYEPGSLDTGSLARILRQIATEITMENVIGYAPEAGVSPRKRTVKVELVDKALGKIRDGERAFVR